MPRLRHLLDSLFLTLIERRPAESRPPGGEGDAAQPPSPREIQALVRLIRDRDAEIARLKAAGDKRAEVFRRNMKAWRQKQRESRKLRKKGRTYRYLLRKRRGQIRAMRQRIRDLERKIASMAAKTAAAGEEVPLPFDDPPARNGMNWIGRLVADATTWQWRHWMRLGSYFQYDPRPVEPDAIPAVRRIPGGWPKFTLVTPSYQQAPYLEHTLRSVLDQDYPNLEYFVLDGGSKDGSVDIIRNHEPRLAGWDSRPDGGQAAAVREGLSRGTGEIMGWLNSDDVIFPGTLAYVADYFAQHPDVDVVYGHRIVIDRQGYETARWVLPPHDPEFLLWADFIPQECTFWRRRIYEAVGGMDPTFQFALDWDLFLRFQRAGAKIVRLPYFLGGFRIHPDQKNAVTIRSDGHREMMRIRREALGDLFQRGGLEKRMNWFQTKAVLTTILWRMGLRV